MFTRMHFVYTSFDPENVVFWVEATPDEASELIEKYPVHDFYKNRITSLENLEKFYLFEGKYGFLVNANTKEIVIHFGHYPYSPMWGAYPSFFEIPKVEISDLKDLEKIEVKRR